MPKTTDNANNPASSKAISTCQPDLWQNAYDKLKARNEDSVDAWNAVLAKPLTNTSKDLPRKEKTLVIIDEELRIITKKQGTILIPRREKQFAVRDLVDKIVQLFGNVKDIGSAAASINPVHAGIHKKCIR